jgi:hypothetical protein
MASQLEIKRQSYISSYSESLDELSEEEKEETKQALYEYVFWRAQGDEQLSRDETESFREAHYRSNDGCTNTVSADGASCNNAQMVGRKLAELGDQIDAMYGDEFEDIMQLYDEPEQAFSSFVAVIKNVFEWDDNGIPKINVGRIAAVLGYCYHLCKKYVSQCLNSYKLLGFLATLSGFLIRFFIQSKFYDWLNRNGGWGQILQSSATGLVNRLGITFGPRTFFIIGITCLAISVFQYARAK